MVRRVREARPTIDKSTGNYLYLKIREEMQHHFGFLQRRR